MTAQDPNARSLQALLLRTQADLHLNDDFESNKAASEYFLRTVGDRQQSLKRSGLHKEYDVKSGIIPTYTEVQSPLYKMVLMLSPHEIVSNGKRAKHAIGVSTEKQMQQLSSAGWSRVLFSHYSPNVDIGPGILSGADFEVHTVEADSIAEQIETAPLLAVDSVPASRVVPSTPNWWQIILKKRPLYKDILDFWMNGDENFLPAWTWTSSLRSKNKINIDTYGRVLCKTVCVIRHHINVLDDHSFPNQPFKTTFIRDYSGISCNKSSWIVMALASDNHTTGESSSS